MRDRIKKILKENDFEWTNDINPVSKEEIIKKMYFLREVGYRRSPEGSPIVDSIYNLALNETQLKSLLEALYNFGDYCHNEGIDIGNQEGYSEGNNAGYSEGWDDGYSERKKEEENEIEDIKQESYDSGYYQGYDEGMYDGHKKGYEEGAEATYYKAFEEGRAYEAGLDVEDLERRESGFDPSEYDDDEYDENY